MMFFNKLTATPAEIEMQYVSMGVFDRISGEMGDPPWFFHGTALEGASRPYPSMILTKDYFRISRNVRDNSSQLDFHLGRTVATRRPLSRGLSLALHTAPCLEEGFSIFLRFMDATVPFLHFSAEVRNSQFRIGLETLIWNDVMAYTVENALLAYVEYAGQFFPSDVARFRVGMRHAPMMKREQYEVRFGCPITFGAPNNLFEIPIELARYRPVSWDENLWKLAQNECVRQYAEVGLEANVRTTLDLIRALTVGGKKPPSITHAAKLLGRSARSLNRRLAEGGTTYQMLIDQVQKERAIKALGDPNLSFAEIAECLGFSDQSSFGRSFRRWFGRSPKQFRSVSDWQLANSFVTE